MDWIWQLYKAYVLKHLEQSGNAAPDNREQQQAFIQIFSESVITILVQEPWQNSVRFKGLARMDAGDAMELIRDPMQYLLENYGGGKFKLNFHHGWNFVATRNFKPEGEPKWKDVPGIDF